MPACNKSEIVKFFRGARMHLGRKRDWPTEAHTKAYKDYERILIWRSLMANFVMVILHFT